MTQLGVAYIAADRYNALLENADLPPRESGSALFADITGFTPLTEAYVQLLGARLGAEELTRQLNLVYDELIADVSNFGGSVIGFSGDAILCWFSEAWPHGVGETPAVRAVACGEAILRSAQKFSSLQLPDGTTRSIGIKVSVASGPANRFRVGEKSIQYFDLLAGGPVDRTAMGEHLISKGELIVDAPTADILGDAVEIVEWRSPGHFEDRFAVVKHLHRPVQPVTWPAPVATGLSRELLRPWLLSHVYDRLQEHAGEFQAELRPAVALFLRFDGIDFDDPTAGQHLDDFLRWVQAILQLYDGTLIQITLGDKGSYLFAAFGAPVAHEDDARRAVAAALELRSPPADLAGVESVQIGISQGTMRVGAYGSTMRRTYGVLGDEVNVAARLMQHARHGEVIATKRIQHACSTEFSWELLPPLSLKGKSHPIPVSRLLGRPAVRKERSFAGSLIGREAQRRQILRFLDPMWGRLSPGVAYIVGEAGMGKSRLLFELRAQLQTERDLSWITCASDEIFRDSFQPFQHFLHEYFSQSPEQTFQENLTRFHDVLDGLFSELHHLKQPEQAKKLDEGRSFLGALIDLHWEDSEYHAAEPRQRLERTIDALTTLIQAESLRQPVILHIEDGQWLDSDSVELLRQLSMESKAYPIALLVACRRLERTSLWPIGAEQPVHQEVCSLHELTPESVGQLARVLLSGEVSHSLFTFLSQKTGGNPFFVEQLLLDLRERELLHKDDRGEWSLSPKALVEVPDTVNAVLIARFDRLVTNVRSAVQMASVLGQEFELRVLSGMMAGGADVAAVVQEAEAAAIWSSSREGHYHFRHALLRDAAYDMQLSVRQRELHRLAAGAIEKVYADDTSSQATELAYHYEQALEADKAADWHTTAGGIALGIYALENVIYHYRKALKCWEASRKRAEEFRVRRMHVLIDLGNALRWRNRALEAKEILQTALDEAVKVGDAMGVSDACTGLANVQYDEGDFRAALENASRAEQIAAEQGSSRRLRTILEVKCWCLFRLGDLTAARQAGEQAVAVSKELNEQGQLAQSLSVLGLVLMASGQNQQAAEHFEQALAIAQDPMDIVGVVNNLGVIATALGDYEKAASRYEEALALARQHNIAEAEVVFRSNLGGAQAGLGRYELAEATLREVIALTGDSNFGDLSETYRFLAEALLGQNRVDEALDAARRALALGREVGAPEFVAIAWRVLGQIAARHSAPIDVADPSGGASRAYSAADCFNESWQICEDTGMKGELPRTLRTWAQFEYDQGHVDVAARMWQHAIKGFSAVGAEKEVERMRAMNMSFSRDA